MTRKRVSGGKRLSISISVLRQRSRHCSVVKEPGSSAHSTKLSAVGLTVYHRSLASGSGRIRPGTELYLALRRSSLRFRTPYVEGGSTPCRRCDAVGKRVAVPTGRYSVTFFATVSTNRTRNVLRPRQRFPLGVCACRANPDVRPDRGVIFGPRMSYMSDLSARRSRSGSGARRSRATNR